MAAVRPGPWRRTALWLVPVIFSLAAGERAVRTFRAERVLPTRGAQWIWAPAAAASNDPVAFYAVRDFRLPARSGPGADWQPGTPVRLLISVSEEYQLFVNGRRVGSGSYELEPLLAEYDLSDLLEAGANRIVIEARSSAGAGGVLASLFMGDAGQPLLVSDGSWRVVRVHRNGVIEGWVSVEAEPAALVWQYPPTGRWASPRLGGPSLRPLPAAEEVVWARQIEQHDESTVASLVDFGEVVEGYLELWLDASPGRVYTIELGTRPPRVRLGPELDAPVTVSLMPGRAFWRDAVPRRFRYVVMPEVRQLPAARVALGRLAHEPALEPPAPPTDS